MKLWLAFMLVVKSLDSVFLSELVRTTLTIQQQQQQESQSTWNRLYFNGIVENSGVIYMFI